MIPLVIAVGSLPLIVAPSFFYIGGAEYREAQLRYGG